MPNLLFQFPLIISDMKNILLAVFSLLVLQKMIAQDTSTQSLELKKFDSLKTKLAASQADTNRVKLLISLSYVYRAVEAEPYAREAVELALKLENKSCSQAV